MALNLVVTAFMGATRATRPSAEPRSPICILFRRKAEVRNGRVNEEGTLFRSIVWIQKQTWLDQRTKRWKEEPFYIHSNGILA